jgi:hypothetical protein
MSRKSLAEPVTSPYLNTLDFSLTLPFVMRLACVCFRATVLFRGLIRAPTWKEMSLAAPVTFCIPLAARRYLATKLIMID